jgi:thiamine biosynthesis lipoprotein ApbE
MWSRVHASLRKAQPCFFRRTTSRAAWVQPDNAMGRKAVLKADAVQPQLSESEDDLLLDLGPLVKGTVVSRPSKIVKTGYVADVLLESGEEIQVRSGDPGASSTSSCEYFRSVACESL